MVYRRKEGTLLRMPFSLSKKSSGSWAFSCTTGFAGGYLFTDNLNFIIAQEMTKLRLTVMQFTGIL